MNAEAFHVVDLEAEIGFEQNRTAIARLGYSGEFQRMWEFYLCYCEAGFVERRTTAAQLVLTNHPITGPVLSGPQIAPYECRTVENGLVFNVDGNTPHIAAAGLTAAGAFEALQSQDGNTYTNTGKTWEELESWVISRKLLN